MWADFHINDSSEPSKKWIIENKWNVWSTFNVSYVTPWLMTHTACLCEVRLRSVWRVINDEGGPHWPERGCARSSRTGLWVIKTLRCTAGREGTGDGSAGRSCGLLLLFSRWSRMTCCRLRPHGWSALKEFKRSHYSHSCCFKPMWCFYSGNSEASWSCSNSS